MRLLIFFALVKICHGGLISLDIRLGDMGVDLVHGCGVGPAADLHRNAFRYLQVIGQGGKAVPQAMDAHIRQIVFPADLLYGAAETVLRDVQDWAGWFPVPLDGRRQLRDHHRHVAGGGGIFVLHLALVFVIRIEHHSALYPNKLGICRNVLPLEGLDLGNPQGGESQQRRNGIAGILDSGDKYPGSHPV